MEDNDRKEMNAMIPDMIRHLIKRNIIIDRKKVGKKHERYSS